MLRTKLARSLRAAAVETLLFPRWRWPRHRADISSCPFVRRTSRRALEEGTRMEPRPSPITKPHVYVAGRVLISPRLPLLDAARVAREAGADGFELPSGLVP